MTALAIPRSSRFPRHASWLPWLGFICASSVAAHDFWFQPGEFRLEPHATTPFTLQVGHGSFRQRSPISPNRIVRFDALAPDGSVIDLRGGLHSNDRPDDHELSFPVAGIYVLVLETDDRAQSHLPAIRFNDYLQAEGLTRALDHRKQTLRMDASGSEKYSRRAKSIIQVGSSAAGQANVTKPLGLLLEIVPEQNPYAEPRSPWLPVQVIYESRPLAGALVKLTDLERDDVPLETHLTDNAGRAVFAMPQDGNWLLNVIWTKPLPDSSEVDFETTFSSLSFGFPPASRSRPSN